MDWIDRTVRMLSLAVLLVIVLATKRCSKDVGSPAAVTTERAAELIEQPGAVAAVVVERGTIAVAAKRPDGSTTTVSRFVPPEGRAEVVVSTGSAVSARLKVKDKGFCFSPGVYGGVAFGLKPAAVYGVGAKLAFAGRWGLDVGLFGPQVAGFAAVSYIPDWRLRNTVLYAGADTKQRIAAGLAVRF